MIPRRQFMRVSVGILNIEPWMKAWVAYLPALTLLRQVRGVSESTCTWDSEGGNMWVTRCNQEFIIYDGASPTDCGMKFCCYCGKPLDQSDVLEDVAS